MYMYICICIYIYVYIYIYTCIPTQKSIPGRFGVCACHGQGKPGKEEKLMPRGPANRRGRRTNGGAGKKCPKKPGRIGGHPHDFSPLIS